MRREDRRVQAVQRHRQQEKVCADRKAGGEGGCAGRIQWQAIEPSPAFFWSADAPACLPIRPRPGSHRCTLQKCQTAKRLGAMRPPRPAVVSALVAVARLAQKMSDNASTVQSMAKQTKKTPAVATINGDGRCACHARRHVVRRPAASPVCTIRHSRRVARRKQAGARGMRRGAACQGRKDAQAAVYRRDRW